MTFSVKILSVLKRQIRLTNWASRGKNIDLEKQTTRVGILCAGFLVEHISPFTTESHVSKLFTSMFPDENT